LGELSLGRQLVSGGQLATGDALHDQGRNLVGQRLRDGFRENLVHRLDTFLF
jgi:hypothetical protein